MGIEEKQGKLEKYMKYEDYEDTKKYVQKKNNREF